VVHPWTESAILLECVRAHCSDAVRSVLRRRAKYAHTRTHTHARRHARRGIGRRPGKLHRAGGLSIVERGEYTPQPVAATVVRRRFLRRSQAIYQTIPSIKQ